MADEDVNRGSRKAWLKTLHRIHYTQFEDEGAKSEAFKEHAKTRPGRASQAARTLPKSKSFSQFASGTPEREAEVKAWQRQRPGGGSPSGASHSQWTSWGSRNPNRGSNAGRTLSNLPRTEKE